MSRCYSETVKIGAEDTGLIAACYLHLEFDDSGRLAGAALSSPGKFEKGALDRLFRLVNALLAAAFEPLDLTPVFQSQNPTEPTNEPETES